MVAGHGQERDEVAAIVAEQRQSGEVTSWGDVVVDVTWGGRYPVFVALLLHLGGLGEGAPPQ